MDSKYLIFGLLFLVIQFLIRITFDFIIFSWFCLHHVFEMIGCLLIGLWFANSVQVISSTRMIIIYIIAIFVGGMFVSGTITLGGTLASAIVLSPLLIGYWLKKWWHYARA